MATHLPAFAQFRTNLGRTARQCAATPPGRLLRAAWRCVGGRPVAAAGPAEAPHRPWQAATEVPPASLRSDLATFANSFHADSGRAFYVPAPAVATIGPGDTTDAPEQSNVVAVYENGIPLGPPHALHEEIRRLGGGRFSHWGDTIYFSSSDGSNPNENGRAYEIAIAHDDSPAGGSESAGGPRRYPLHPEWRGLKIVGPGELPRRLQRPYPLAARLCRGDGVEIGGAAYNEVRDLNARNVGRRLEWHYVQESLAWFDGYVRRVDIIAEGDQLPLADASLDFVFSSHVLEHFPDPIRALREWDRVLRPGGVMLAVVPHKERTFDRHLPRTPLATQFERHGRAVTGAGVPDQHYSIWITQDLIDLIRAMNDRGWINWTIEAVEDRDRLRGNGFAVACRKTT